MLFIKFYAMIVFVPGCGSAWLERRLREAEVASSNPAAPTTNSRKAVQVAAFFGVLGMSILYRVKVPSLPASGKD